MLLAKDCTAGLEHVVGLEDYGNTYKPDICTVSLIRERCFLSAN